jgi:hypothetical protein
VTLARQIRSCTCSSNSNAAKYFILFGGGLPGTLAETNGILHAFLPLQIQEVLEVTGKPFAQPIRDLAVAQMVFGRVVLVGESAFVLRPHPAAAADNRMTLDEACVIARTSRKNCATFPVRSKYTSEAKGAARG